MNNPDIGAQTLSPSIAGMEIPAAKSVPIFLVIESARNQAVIGFGDRHVRTLSLDGESTSLSDVTRLSSTPLSAHADIGGDGVLIGTDDGKLLRLAAGAVTELVEVSEKWVQAVAVHDTAGLRAFVAGKTLVVLNAAGQEVLRKSDHPSTLTDISFSPDGSWVAVSHYGGVSAWNTAELDREKALLEWHGSHTRVEWCPTGKFIMTAMQDKEVHCWRWHDRTGIRMSGYPSKIRSISWTADGQYLAASGADTVTSWDCGGKGPSGKPPLEFGYAYNSVSTQVAAHPADKVMAGGFSDGSVLIGDIEQETAMIARAKNGSAIVALVWAQDGNTLVAADEAGAVAVMRMLRPLV